jgi:hypothetical protein
MLRMIRAIRPDLPACPTRVMDQHTGSACHPSKKTPSAPMCIHHDIA